MSTTLNSLRGFLLIFPLSAAAVFITVLQCLDFSWRVSLYDSIISAVLLTLAVWVGKLVMNNYTARAGITIYGAFIGMITAVAAWYADKLLLRWLLHDEPGYLPWLHASAVPRLFIAMLTSGWLVCMAALQKKVAALEKQLGNMTDAATLHREAELFKLRQQLQPHFLYNSLNSINALILIAPEQAQEMVGKLSDFLRHSVKRETRDLIPLEEELRYIASYLDIEAARFGDRLEVIYNINVTDDAMLPPFLLQPILENAIKFGLYGSTGKVNILVDIQQTAPLLEIRITNPYDQDNAPPGGTGFGLEGIRRRLYLLYARMDLLETERKEGLFITTLKIPPLHA